MTGLLACIIIFLFLTWVLVVFQAKELGRLRQHRCPACHRTHLGEMAPPPPNLKYGAGYTETDPKWLEAYENKMSALRKLWK